MKREGIQPIKSHFEIIKAMRIKYLAAISTINAAMAVISLTGPIGCNYISFVLFGFGTIAPILMGNNICEIFFKYYQESENELELSVENRKDIVLHNVKIIILHATSLLLMLIGTFSLFILKSNTNVQEAAYIAVGVCLILLGTLFLADKEVDLSKINDVIKKILHKLPQIIKGLVLLGILWGGIFILSIVLFENLNDEIFK